MKAKMSWLVALIALLAGCAAPVPVPFQVIDSNNVVYQGIFGADNQSVEVRIGDTLYQGFYIVSSSIQNTTTWVGRFGQIPRESISVASSNNALAHLVATDGQRLTCEFLFQGARAIGQCMSPQGKTYQLVADRESGRP